VTCGERGLGIRTRLEAPLSGLREAEGEEGDWVLEQSGNSQQGKDEEEARRGKQFG